MAPRRIRRKIQSAGGPVGWKGLPDDVLGLIKPHLSEDDALALQVALKRRIDRIDLLAWTPQTVSIVYDPSTRHVVSRAVRLKNPPLNIPRVLHTFEKLHSLQLEDVEEVISLGLVCSPTLKSVRLQGCTVDAADPSPPKRLLSMELTNCRVLLGPADGQWPLLSSRQCDIGSVTLSECTLEDVHGTGALSLTSPKLEYLSITSCTYNTVCAEPTLFGAIAPSLKSGWLDTAVQNHTCQSGGEGAEQPPAEQPPAEQPLAEQPPAAQPLDLVSREFLRNVVPHLTSLRLRKVSRHTLEQACLLSKKLRELDLDCRGCCLDHRLEDVSPPLAAQLTALHIQGHYSPRGPVPQRLPLSKFAGLVKLTARGVKAREAFRLLEACHSCPRLQTVKVEVCDDSALGEDETWEDVKGWETRIEVSLPRLTAMTVPWVFTELDLRGCSKLSSLVVAGEWRASSLQGPETQSGHVMRGMAARVTPPKANGSWGVEGVKGPWKPKPVLDVHWHSANTRCHAWAFGCCTVGTDDQLSKPQLVVKRFLTAMSRRENVPRVARD